MSVLASSQILNEYPTHRVSRQDSLPCQCFVGRHWKKVHQGVCVNRMKEVAQEAWVRLSNTCVGTFVQRRWAERESTMRIIKLVNSVLYEMWIIGASVKRLAPSLINTRDGDSGLNKSWLSRALVQLSSWKCTKVFYGALKWFPLLSLAPVPLSLWQIGKKSVELIRGETSRLDKALEIIQEIGSILKKAYRFTYGLISLNVVAVTVLPFVSSLGIVGSILGLAEEIVQIRSLSQTRRFARQFDQMCQSDEKQPFGEKQFERALHFLCGQTLNSHKDRKYYQNALSKHFNCDGQVLHERLTHVAANANKFSPVQKNQILKTLKKRLVTKQLSTSLALTAGLIGFVAGPIFLISPLVHPPLIGLGFACIAASACVSLAKLIIDWKTENSFNLITQEWDSMSGFPPKKTDAEKLILSLESEPAAISQQETLLTL